MPISYLVDDASQQAEDNDADFLNPVVVATEKFWQVLLAAHTPVVAQCVPAMWPVRRERNKRSTVIR